jgi:hypothetical protein
LLLEAGRSSAEYFAEALDVACDFLLIVPSEAELQILAVP